MLKRILFALALCVCGLAWPSSAAAQGAEVGLSYSFLRLVDGGALNMPAGFLVSVAGGKHSISIAGEIAGNYKSEGGVTLQFYTFHVGPRFTSYKSAEAQPWVEFLLGGTHVRVVGESDTKFSIEPAGGVDVPLTKSKKVRARFGIGVPIVFADGETLKGLRVQAGVVFGM